MKVILSARAEKQLRKYGKIEQIILAKKIRQIRDNREVIQEEKLSGFKNIYRVRVGNYRIVYQKTSSNFYIILIGHRKEIYQLLKQLFD